MGVMPPLDLSCLLLPFAAAQGLQTCSEISSLRRSTGTRGQGSVLEALSQDSLCIHCVSHLCIMILWFPKESILATIEMQLHKCTWP